MSGDRFIRERHKGGDVIIETGAGWSPDPAHEPALDGSLIFKVGAREVVRLDPGGDFSVEGRCVANDLELYLGIRRWFGELIALGARSGEA
jgi:hypothetical protein